MVVVGEVLGQKGVHHPANGLETAVTLKITDVLKGSVRPGQAVTFHTRGGEKVLVFIESVDGRLYNLGLSMGVWTVHEVRIGDVVFTRALRDGLAIVGEAAVEHGPLSYAEMRSRVRYAARNPRFDNETLRGHFGEGR